MFYLVTGGAGFIGSHVVDRLLANGKKIICLDNFDNFYDPAIKRRNISEAIKNPDFKLIEGDIRDLKLLKDIFSSHKISHVFHPAARAGVRPSIADPLLYEDVNIKGTMNMLEMAKEFKVENFVFASSSSVYGENKKFLFLSQTMWTNPSHHMRQQKRHARRYALPIITSTIFPLPV